MDDFHEFRMEGIGGSDAPIIMGVSPWCKIEELLHEKVHKVVKNQDNYATRHGKALEDPTREKFEAIKRELLSPCRVISKKRSWLRANIDCANFSKTMVVEIKNPLGPKDHVLAKEGKVPDKYYPQCQHILAACREDGFDVDKIYYFSHFKGDYVTIEVPIDEAYIVDMLKKEEEFWQSVLLGRKRLNTA